ncbi:hypothetical protein PIB30_078215 [Stylosanthes scabra]|uniref:Transposase MuDR plant domain-containing protein n=1 Tax=Stylosanthes scabra TaxID=79078 RepID=A0ABU6SR77_9FABA|nr:hypothetical protein [Stylosanthes scabra]
MQPVNTLEELKSVILRNMGVDSDAHVRAMFEFYRRYGSRDVMELLTEMQTVNIDAGGSTSSSQGGLGAIIAAPIQFANPEVGDDDSDEDFVANTDESSESSDDSKFVPESQARQEEQREGVGGGGEDYDLDGGSEFRVGHRLSTREAVHMAVKNYNIKRASEYRVVESDPYKYVCRCKRYDAGCPWLDRPINKNGNEAGEGAMVSRLRIDGDRGSSVGSEGNRDRSKGNRYGDEYENGGSGGTSSENKDCSDGYESCNGDGGTGTSCR